MTCILGVMTLKEYLSSLTITDAEFGEKIGVSQSQISRIKHGKTSPSLEVIVAIEKMTKGKVRAEDIYAEVKRHEDAERQTEDAQ
jgi:transcriptional regulator with XRE-family HTH domain